MYWSADNEQKNEERADSDGSNEYEHRICAEERHSVARFTDDGMTGAVENSLTVKRNAVTGGALRVVCLAGDKRVQSQADLQGPCGDGAAHLQLRAVHHSVGEHELDCARRVGVYDALALHGRHRHLQEAGGIGLNVRSIWKGEEMLKVWLLARLC